MCNVHDVIYDNNCPIVRWTVGDTDTVSPRYSWKTARDYLMNFSKPLLAPKKRTFAQRSVKQTKTHEVNPVVVVSVITLVSFIHDEMVLKFVFRT